MRRADFLRAEKSRLSSVAHCFQSSDDMLSEKSDRSADVFEKDEGRSALPNNAGRIGPKIPLVARSQALASDAVGLARDARSDAIHHSAPGAAVEGANIRPAKRRTQAQVFMRRRQYLASEGFDLHCTDRSSRRQGEFDSEFESAAPGAQREDIEAVRNHTHPPPFAARALAFAAIFFALATIFMPARLKQRRQIAGVSDSPGVLKLTTVSTSLPHFLHFIAHPLLPLRSLR
ncbi:MAG TPA: hypothetical protein VMY35_07565 [Phycisphaerae bacterium]|nr:hypothetical protein [Phycisphaerae bacterium]